MNTPDENRDQEKLREQAQAAAAAMDLQLSKSCCMELAVQLYRRILDSDRRTLGGAS